MGAFKKAMSWLKAEEVRGADPTLPWGSSYIPTNGQIGLVAAGVPINDDAALTISTVYTCIAILADAIATLPLVAYKRTADNSKKIVSPSPQLVSNPWPEGILQDWLTQVMVSLLLRGNFYGKIADRDDRGYPTLIMPLHPDNVTARRGTDGKRQYRVNGDLVPTADMLHIPAFLVPGSFIGLNPVEYMRGGWGLALASERYGGQFFANSAMPSGVIEIDEDLSPEETLELARDWKMAHGGLGNAQYPAVLTGGAKFQSISLNAQDAQFIETRGFQQNEIASFFRVPLHLLGMQDRTTSYGTGIEQMDIGFIVNTLLPWINRIETYLSNLLPPSQVVKFDLGNRMRGDSGQRSMFYTSMINAGLMSADEARDMEGLPPLPNGEGKLYYRPVNYTTTTVMKSAPPQPGASGGIGGGDSQEPGTGAPAPGQDTNPNRGYTIPEIRMEPHITVEPTPIQVAAPIVNVAPPDVWLNPTFNVEAPQVHVEPPVVNVAPPEVRVNVEAPNVTVQPPAVEVEAPLVFVEPAPPRRREIKRDARGNIIEIREVDE